MRKHELLVPAGDMDCLMQAINNGADAIYGACQNFGARKFAKNFTNDEIIDAINLCHLYGVKFYVTMNTLVKNSEVKLFLSQVEFLYQHGVDAIIMQDFGMISYVLNKYPNLEIHASTQFNNSSIDTVKLLYEMGVKRVVLSRELSLQEINNISVPIEKEVFIHGALCISYSGCCLMSSMIGGRSGNRGECAGTCRLPYRLFSKNKLLSNKKYLLSTKELNTSYNFWQLLNSDIDSFKIEGRMKSPEYVGFITRMYRNLIDNHINLSQLDEENEKLRTIFNREFTCGHLFNCDISDIMNIHNPNHVGLTIGKVISVTDKKIELYVEKDLRQGDGIRFLHSGKGMIVNYLYNSSGLLVSNVSKNSKCFVDNKVNLNELDLVSKTLDSALMKDLKKITKKRILVNFIVDAHVGKNLLVTISDGVNKISQKGEIISKSKTLPLTKEMISEKLVKLGNTPFICNDIVVNCDTNIFIPLKEINDIRRVLVEKLISARMKLKYEPIIEDISFPSLNISVDTQNSATVFKEDQLLACLKLGFKRIYVCDFLVYKKYEMFDNIYYSIPRCLFSIKNNLKKQSLIKEFSNLNTGIEYISDYTMNVYNIYTAYFLYKLGVSKITLSVELDYHEIIEFVNLFYKKFKFYPNIEVLGYGLVENMIIKGNIFNIQEKNEEYYLTDLRNRKFPIYYNGIQTIIFNYHNQPIDDYLLLKNISSIRYQFFKETKDEIIAIMKKYQ